MYDLIIIGSGPAGLSAAIYAQRAELKTIIIEKEAMSGGQIVTTYEVDNYPGIPGINGFDLAMKMRDHAAKLGAKFITEEVIDIDISQKIKRVKTEKETYETKTILVATGAKYANLDAPGEMELAGKGVSYCATCDGAFFRDKTVAVVGGGDVAIEDAIFLARLAKKVYLIHRRDTLRGIKSLQKTLFACENVEMVWDTEVIKIEGTSQVEKIQIRNKKTKEEKELKIDGIFIAVGIHPITELLVGKVKMENDYIIANESCITSALGVFVAGDARKKALRQIITAASDGANAVTSVERYLSE
jgi:thioredoxin reductase (NADPH)